MTIESTIKLDMDAPSIPSVMRSSRTLHFVQSAIFVGLFVIAFALVVLGALFALSNNPVRAAQAYPILLFNSGIIGCFGVYLIARVWTILFSTRRRLSAPLLHRRFVLIFSLAALMPAILVGLFSTSLISRNINDLFGESVRSNLTNAQEFYNAYVKEEFSDLGRDIASVQSAVNGSRGFLKNRITYSAFLQRLAQSRGLDAIYILNRKGMVYVEVESPTAPVFQLPSQAAFDQIDRQDFIFNGQGEIDFLVGLGKLDVTESGLENPEDVYLYVGRYLRSDSPVLSSLNGIDDAGRALDRYNQNQAFLNKTFFLTFVETALLVLFAAIWLGFALANRIIDPLGRLVDAAEKVREGDFTARVSVEGNWGEVSDLGSAFNRMTRQLNSQRDDLIREHDISEQRRQFSEAVLSGVRAGVIGLTQEGRITLLNQSAARLLGQPAAHMLQKPLSTVLPDFVPAFRAARDNILATAEDQVDLDMGNGVKNFDLRVSAYEGPRQDTGWVLTFDDMTRLVAAQRHSAWREVARRIAHEIKNPLTPIQLSVERLNRKYAKEVKSDPDVFENCTSTIIRQVESLERMVDEFSAFARMPAPIFQFVDLQSLLDQVLFAQRVSLPDVDFILEDNITDVALVRCDERLISQALTNIYKNAGEAIVRRMDESGHYSPAGEIITRLEMAGEFIKLCIYDNGTGWPLKDKDRLLEPYMTTRKSGTGLGLAIVKRIAEDHGGDLQLDERPDGVSGAYLELTLPQTKETADLKQRQKV